MFFLNSLYKLLETISDYALKELYDESGIKKKLMDLAVLYELEEIDEEEYNQLEKTLLERLDEAREYNRRKALEEGELEEYEDDNEEENETDESEEPGIEE